MTQPVATAAPVHRPARLSRVVAARWLGAAALVVGVAGEVVAVVAAD